MVTLKKSSSDLQYIVKPDKETTSLFIDSLTCWLKCKPLDTNEVFLRIMEKVFIDRIVIGNVNLLDILVSNFILLDNQKWSIHDELELRQTG